MPPRNFSTGTSTRYAMLFRRRQKVCLRARQVATVLFIFVAEGFQNIAVGNQELHEFYSEWPGERLGIVDSHLPFHMAEIAAAEAFLNSQSLAVGKSRGIQPALVVESRGIHNQRVA